MIYRYFTIITATFDQRCSRHRHTGIVGHAENTVTDRYVGNTIANGIDNARDF
ncbi:hypothetical protein R7K02_26155 [Klebsiella pneumoniae]|nr:hypothetical protein [Klebsiella pneumoniae]MDW1257535.1 hypothetical protein [Klebsiella pneumoniae]